MKVTACMIFLCSLLILASGCSNEDEITMTRKEPANCQDVYIPGDSRRMCEDGEKPIKSNKNLEQKLVDCQDYPIPGDNRPTCKYFEKPIHSNLEQYMSYVDSVRDNPKYHNPISVNTENTSNTNAIKRINCIARLVNEQKNGVNDYTSSEIASLCDYLFPKN
ncbi:MAG: hypothetical protein RPU41_03195 [Candidatus Sedimenticola sp. (ex Thyasira tokunagai)]